MSARSRSQQLECKGMPVPFGCIHQIGLSAASVQRLDRYRHERERQGAAVTVLAWPDGIWCVLAIYGGLASLALSTSRIAEVYADACMMIRGGYLPLLTLRYRSNYPR